MRSNRCVAVSGLSGRMPSGLEHRWVSLMIKWLGHAGSGVRRGSRNAEPQPTFISYDSCQLLTVLETLALDADALLGPL
jgi:hypothetical protein